MASPLRIFPLFSIAALAAFLCLAGCGMEQEGSGFEFADKTVSEEKLKGEPFEYSGIHEGKCTYGGRLGAEVENGYFKFEILQSPSEIEMNLHCAPAKGSTNNVKFFATGRMQIKDGKISGVNIDKGQIGSGGLYLLSKPMNGMVWTANLNFGNQVVIDITLRNKDKIAIERFEGTLTR